MDFGIHKSDDKISNREEVVLPPSDADEVTDALATQRRYDSFTGV